MSESDVEVARNRYVEDEKNQESPAQLNTPKVPLSTL